MLDTTEIGKKQRRPACGQCGGTGYVYLWSVAQTGQRAWFCDRCKRTWSDAAPIFAAVLGDGVGPAKAPVLVNTELQPAMRSGRAVEPGNASPRPLRLVDRTVKVARTAQAGVDSLDAVDLVVGRGPSSGDASA